jgi:cell division protein ZapA (FtsZ GTPase activity inhibitor)
MAKDVRINVSAEGADEAAQDLRDVASAEGQVGQAADGATGKVKGSAEAKKKAADSTAELDDRNRTLAERFRALGPEAALVGDAIDSLTLKQGLAASAVGVLGVAVLGATMAYQRWKEKQAETKAEMQEMEQELRQQTDAFVQMAAAVEKAQQAASRYEDITAEAGLVSVRRSLGVAAGTRGVGAEAAERAAIPLGFEEGISDEQLALYQQWLQLGHGNGYSSPREAWSAFKAASRTQGFAARIRAEMALWNRQGPMRATQMQREVAERMRAITPGRLAEQGVEDLAGIEGVRPEDLRDELAGLAFTVQSVTAASGADARGREAQAIRRLLALLRRHPQLGGLEVETRRGAGTLGGILTREGIDLEAAGVNVTIFQGTNYITPDGKDPAGRIVEAE